MKFIMGKRVLSTIEGKILIGVTLLALSLVNPGHFRPAPVLQMKMIPATHATVTTPVQSGQLSTQVPEVLKRQVLATYGKLPLSFEANRGQTDSEVKFLSRGRGYTLFLTSTEVVLALGPDGGREKMEGNLSAQRNPQSEADPPRAEKIENLKSAVVRMKLVGATPILR